MLTDEEETRLLLLATEKGWLSRSELCLVRAPEQESFAPSRFGVRLDALIKSGVLSEEAISELLREEASASVLPSESISVGSAPTVQPLEPEISSKSSESLPATSDVRPFVSPMPGWERYELLSLLGRGGMGTVYKARDLRLHRFVAVKFLHAEHDSAVQRFLQEARAQARIDHENVCKVHEVDTVAGKPYIAMELVSGLPLHSVMGQLRLEEKLCITRDAAEALHAAHRLGIVHRDVKPSNILVQRRDDSTWRPVLMDFGLAHDAQAEHHLTRSGVVMGTPGYMSPEQARGDTRSLDRRTDVYALGATLFELLSGRTPFESENQAEVLLKVLLDDPPSLRTVQPGLPAELDTIVMKCLQKDPAQRYASARALAEDLQRYLNGEPIAGKRASLLYRVRRRAQKHRAAVTVGFLALVGLTVLAAYGIEARRQVQDQKIQAAARAKLSQKLGQDIKEMEWFMRSVHQMPVHDARYANTILQARMKKLEELRAEQGTAGDGLVQYALGQAYLALRDFDRANEYLVDAQRKGNDTPELRRGLGRVLGEQYKKELEKALRTGDVSSVKARKQELREQYLQPAVALLRESQAADLGFPQLLEGLVALYSERYDDALNKADEMIQKAPWLYEAQQLAGDAHFARGIDQRNQTDFNAAKVSFERAIGRYKKAAEIGRTDAQLYEAIAETYLQWADIAVNLQQRFDELSLFEQVNTYCQIANTIAPSSASCYSKTVQAYAGLIRAKLLNRKSVNDDIEKALKLAKMGLFIDSKNPYLYESVARIYHAMAIAEDLLDSSKPYFELAIENHRQALSIKPNFTTGLVDLALVYSEFATAIFDATGIVPQDKLWLAVHYLKAAYTIDPNYTPAWIGLFGAYSALIQMPAMQGDDPALAHFDMLDQFQKFVSLNINAEDLFFYLIIGQHRYIDYLIWKQDGTTLAEALKQQRTVAAHAERHLATGSRSLLFVQLYGAVDEAQVQLSKGRDPIPAIQAGQALIRRCAFWAPFQAACHDAEAALALLAADDAARRGEPVSVHLQQAVTAARRAVVLYPIEPEHNLQLARAVSALAEVKGSRAAPDLIAEGLRSVAAGLKQSAGYTEFYALRGRLHLLQAQRAATAKGRMAWATEAQGDFTLAVKKNPLLAGAYGKLIAQANALATQPLPR